MIHVKEEDLQRNAKLTNGLTIVFAILGIVGAITVDKKKDVKSMITYGLLAGFIGRTMGVAYSCYERKKIDEQNKMLADG